MRYLIFAIISVFGSALSFAFWMVNPVTAIFLALSGVVVRMTGREPPSNFDALLPFSILWPLLVYPVYLINHRFTGGRGWSYVLMLSATFFATALVLQLWRSSR